MRVLLAILVVSLAPFLAGCATETGGAPPDAGAPPAGTSAAPTTPASSSGDAQPTPVPAGSSTQAPGSQQATPTRQATTTPASAPKPAAPASLDGVWRFDHDDWRQQTTFRPDGTFTYTQSLEGESGTWDGTYDLKTGKGRMNDGDITIRFVHDDLVSFEQVLLRRVLPDGSIAKPRADERIVGGEFVSRVDDKVEGYTFHADGTWSMTGSLKTMDSFGTWSGSGRYGVAEGLLVWDQGLDAGKTFPLVWWSENVVLIDGKPHALTA